MPPWTATSSSSYFLSASVAAPPAGKAEERALRLPVRQATGGDAGSGPEFTLPKLQSPTLPPMSPPSLSPPPCGGPGGLGAAPLAAAANVTLAEPGASAPAYEELLVLVHGLKGTVEDFTFFQRQLVHSPPAVAGQLLVHATDVNTDKTHDGVVEGGTRLVSDVRRVVAENPSLTRISLVGFSLGGVYVRYAVGVLYDPRTSTIAGLKPQKLVTVASPNLGVRRFGVYRFIPQPLFGATKFLFGKTGDILVMNDDPVEPLLLSMSKDDSPLGIPFLSALSCFSRRVLYGNLRQDFMVNWGTSVLDASIHGIGGQDLQDVIQARAAAAEAEPIDEECDEKGCKIAFTYTYPLPEQSPGVSGTAAAEAADAERPMERGMASRLQAIGWEVVAIDFPMPLPLAHNRIMAMSRGPIHTRMNAPGRRAVLHLVDTLVGDFDVHVPLFKPVSSSRGGGTAHAPSDYRIVTS
jgi:hypothetical protein